MQFEANIKPRFLISKYLSLKLQRLSFVAIFMVVLLHSYNIDIGLAHEKWGVNFWVQNFFSQGGIAAISVPLFFFISGFLFFINGSPNLWSWYLIKYKKRIKTLLVPYLFWSVWSMFLLFVLQLPHLTQNFFQHKIIDYSLFQILFILILKPVAYQLWFIRDLMAIIVLSPVFGQLSKSMCKIFLTISLVLWLLNIDLRIISNVGLLFFTFGGYIGLYKPEFLNKTFSNWFLAVPIWFSLVLLRVALIATGSSIASLSLLLNVGILAGLIAVWTAYDSFNIYFINIKANVFFKVSPFFIYLAHEPLLSIFKRTVLYLFGYTEISRLMIYIFSPIIIVTLLLFSSRVLQKITPGLYGILIGKRKLY